MALSPSKANDPFHGQPLAGVDMQRSVLLQGQLLNRRAAFDIDNVLRPALVLDNFLTAAGPVGRHRPRAVEHEVYRRARFGDGAKPNRARKCGAEPATDATGSDERRVIAHADIDFVRAALVGRRIGRVAFRGGENERRTMTRQSIARQVGEDLNSASWIRAMFEVGVKLKRELGEENVFDFSLGNPNADPPPEFFEALRACARDRQPARHRYMSNAGFRETRAAIAGLLSDGYSMTFDSDSVIVTSGTAGAMNVVLRTILDPGDEVVVPAPYFVEYRFYIQHAQGRMVLAQTDRDCSLDVDAIEAAITPRTRAVIVNTPNNPTGVVYSQRVCRALGAMLLKHDGPQKPIYLICDDVYRRIVYDMERCPAPAEHYPRSIIVSSFSKDLSIAGERIGYIAVGPRVADRDTLLGALVMINRTLGFVNAPAFMQRVVAESLSGLCDIAFYRRNRDLLAGALRDYGYEFPRPEGALYIFPRSPIEDDRRFIEILKEQRILAVPGCGFGRPGAFRLSYAVDHATIERSLSGFKRAIESAQS